MNPTQGFTLWEMVLSISLMALILVFVGPMLLAPWQYQRQHQGDVIRLHQLQQLELWLTEQWSNPMLAAPVIHSVDQGMSWSINEVKSTIHCQHAGLYYWANDASDRPQQLLDGLTLCAFRLHQSHDQHLRMELTLQFTNGPGQQWLLQRYLAHAQQ